MTGRSLMGAALAEILVTWPMVLGITAFVVGIVIAVGRTMTRMRRLDQEAATFRTVAEEAGDGLLLQERDSRIVWANKAYCSMFGYSLEELIGKYPLEYALPPDIRPPSHVARAFRFDSRSTGFNRLETKRNIRRNGEEFINQLKVSEVPSKSADQPPRYVTACRDISEQKRRERALREAHEEISRQASTDALTGLANRTHMTKHLETQFTAGPFALLAIDLDDFKGVNDRHGHAAGDAVLRHVGRTIEASRQEGWFAARIGGDEFVVVVPGVERLVDAARIAIGLKRKLAKPLAWDSARLVCGASLGVALSEGVGGSVDKLLHAADVALYAAKVRPNTRVALYDDAMHETHARAVELRRSLAEAVRQGDMNFHVQPTFNLDSKTARGFETLVRWSHPELGPVAPDTIIPVLGELGLLRDLDRLAAMAAFGNYCKLRDAGLPDALMGFNVSPGTLQTPDFADFLIWEADRLDIPPGQIIVELLETTIFSLDGSEDGTTGQIARLRDAGFRPLLDDFGVGYAGLSHLAELGVEGLKIDRSLVSKIDSDETARRIVEAILNLCGNLGFRVVAEGVENEAQREILIELGCAVGQGYLFARPMTIEQAVELYATVPRRGGLKRA